MSRADAGFPRQRRIRRSRDFRELGRRGCRLRGEAFSVLWAPAAEGEARLGVTVSRRVGGAVVRNRVKRRIREWFRRDSLAREGGRDLVVIARPAAARLGPGETGAELSGLLGGAR